MADITTMTGVGTEIVSTPNSNIDPIADFLQENGLDNLEEGSHVVQRNNTIVTIPNDTSDSPIQEILDNLEVTEVGNPSLPESIETPPDTDYREGRGETALNIDNTDNIIAAAMEIPTNGIAPNPPKEAISEETVRFSGAIWYEKITKQTVVIGGQGGIGSWVTMILSRMHPAQIYMYDPDTVETVNLAGQCYGTESIGKKKVNAMATFAMTFSNYHVCMAIPSRFTPDTLPGDIMIGGFDNMDARKVFFNVWKKYVSRHSNPEKCLFIDGRLAMSDFQVFCITGDDTFNQKRYESDWLFSDAEADETICSMKQTTYCACMIGSVIVNLFTNFIANQVSPMSHDLPFKTFYDANMLYFKTEN